MGSRSLGKHASCLAFHLPCQPELCRTIDELLQLCGHIAVTGRASEDNTVSLTQIIKRAFRNGNVRLIYLVGVALFRFHVLHIIWKFLDTAENNVDAGDLLSTLVNRFGQRLNMAVYAVIDDKYFHPGQLGQPAFFRGSFERDAPDFFASREGRRTSEWGTQVAWTVVVVASLKWPKTF